MGERIVLINFVVSWVVSRSVMKDGVGNGCDDGW